MKKTKFVILTGAGISAESGLATFRAQNGLWEGYNVDDVATYEGYLRDPVQVHRFYNMLRKKLQQPNVKPNTAHFALAKLEYTIGSENVTIVTQNVDNLHEQAGSKNIIHMHGELLKVRDEQTGQIFDCYDDIYYEKNKMIRPHIVWFGEIPLYIDEIHQQITQADYFIAIGTSGHIYPAANFVQLANQFGAHTIELNLEPSLKENLFDLKIYGPASQIVPHFIQQLLTKIA